MAPSIKPPHQHQRPHQTNHPITVVLSLLGLYCTKFVKIKMLFFLGQIQLQKKEIVLLFCDTSETDCICKCEGGSSGIGLETARVLALRHAHVIIAARNMNAANEAKQYILKENASARIDVLKLDLSSLKSVREFADEFLSLNLPLNILINNAGIMFCPFQLSEDGIELQFATNHLGHFLLTNLLLDKMKQTAKATGIEGRIVILSSIAQLHTYPGGIVFDRINDENGYSDKRAYGQSKLANVLHANELSRRLKAEDANITVNSLHPGLIMTNLMRYSINLMRIINLMTRLLWKNIPQGAATSCYVALHPSLKGETGKYYVDCNELDPMGFAKDEVLAKKLWDFSEDLVNSASKLNEIN